VLPQDPCYDSRKQSGTNHGFGTYISPSLEHKCI